MTVFDFDINFIFMAEDVKKQRGGRREGAGRKPTGKKYKIFSVCGTEEEIEEIKMRASQSGKTLSRFVIDAALKNSLK